jgi:hypothetical protein
MSTSKKKPAAKKSPAKKKPAAKKPAVKKAAVKKAEVKPEGVVVFANDIQKPALRKRVIAWLLGGNA